jgi:predicted ArsR family transcriptional regulator
MTDMPRGRPQEITDKRLIEIGKAADGPCFTVSEVAPKTPIDPPAVRGRLDQLEEQSVLRVKKPGAEKIYWFPDGD